MNRKLKKYLKQIYASEQPDRFPDFLYQIQKERNRRILRFAAPVTVMLFASVIAGYGYFSTRDAYRPRNQISVEETETSAVSETSVTSAETFTTTVQTTFTTLRTTCTTLRTETTVPDTSIMQIHLPIQTVTTSAPETTFHSETSATAIPETETIQTEAEVVQPETTIISDSIETTFTTTATSVTTETLPLETTTETLPEEFLIIPTEDFNARQDNLIKLRQYEALDYITNSLTYANAHNDAELEFNVWLTELRRKENPFLSYYEQKTALLDETNSVYSMTDFTWSDRQELYTEIMLHEDFLIEQYFTDTNQTENLENYRHSGEHFRQLYEDFWNPTYSLCKGEPVEDYLNAKLIQIRVLTLMEYFNYIPYSE